MGFRANASRCDEHRAIPYSAVALRLTVEWHASNHRRVPLGGGRIKPEGSTGLRWFKFPTLASLSVINDRRVTLSRGDEWLITILEPLGWNLVNSQCLKKKPRQQVRIPLGDKGIRALKERDIVGIRLLWQSVLEKRKGRDWVRVQTDGDEEGEEGMEAPFVRNFTMKPGKKKSSFDSLVSAL